MTTFLFENFGQAALSAALSGSAATLLVSPTEAETFPAPVDGEVFTLILSDGKLAPEIVWCTSNPGTGVLTVLRGQESSGAHGWGVGTLAIHTLTKRAIEWFSTGGQIDWKDDVDASFASVAAQIATIEASVATLAAANNQEVLDRISAIEDAQSQIGVLASAVTDTDYSNALYQTTVNAALAAATATATSALSASSTNAATIASLTTSLSAEVTNRAAAITTEASARVTYDSANTTITTSHTASIADHTGRIGTLESLRVTDLASIATIETTLSTNIGTNSAAITTESIARVSGDAANASAITSLTATVGGVSSTLTAVAAVQADITGQFYGSYGVTLASGGVFSSFELFQSGGGGTTVSEFRIHADVFKVDGIYPMVYNSGTGTLSIHNLYADAAWIIDLTIGAEKFKVGATAVTAFASSSGTTSITAGAAETTMASCSLSCTGAKVIIDAAITSIAELKGDLFGGVGSDNYTVGLFTLYRNGTLLRQTVCSYATKLDIGGGTVHYIIPGGGTSLQWVDGSPGGSIASPTTNTYSVTLYNFNFNSVYTQASLSAHEIRKAG